MNQLIKGGVISNQAVSNTNRWEKEKCSLNKELIRNTCMQSIHCDQKNFTPTFIKSLNELCHHVPFFLHFFSFISYFAFCLLSHIQCFYCMHYTMPLRGAIILKLYWYYEDVCEKKIILNFFIAYVLEIFGKTRFHTWTIFESSQFGVR